MSTVRVHEFLADELKAGMETQGLSQMQLAKESGVPQGNISAILNKGRPATEATWQKLFEVTHPDPPRYVCAHGKLISERCPDYCGLANRIDPHWEDAAGNRVERPATKTTGARQ